VEELTGYAGYSYSSSSNSNSNSNSISKVDQERSKHLHFLTERVRSGALLLLVADRFDESLLLLGKVLGWHSPRQLAYFRLKDRFSGLAYRKERRAPSSPSSPSPPSLDSRLAALQPFDSFVHRLANIALDNLLAHWYVFCSIVIPFLRPCL
jgi:hypothetical protein